MALLIAMFLAILFIACFFIGAAMIDHYGAKEKVAYLFLTLGFAILGVFIWFLMATEREVPLETYTEKIITTNVKQYVPLVEEDRLFTIEVTRAKRWHWWSQYSKDKILSVKIVEIKEKL